MKQITVAVKFKGKAKEGSFASELMKAEKAWRDEEIARKQAVNNCLYGRSQDGAN